MQTVREQSGRALAVLDYIDFLAANEKAKNSPFLMMLYLFAWKGCHRGFIRECENISNAFSNIVRAATHDAPVTELTRVMVEVRSTVA